MSYVTLNPAEALELFCRIVAKKEKLKLVKFSESKFLMQKLFDYSQKDYYSVAEKEIFGVKESAVTGRVSKGDKKLYTLCFNIRNSLPVVMPADTLRQFENYMGKTDFLSGVAVSQSWQPPAKTAMFLNTSRVLYYAHKDEDGKGKRTDGIGLAILTFSAFFKAEIRGFKDSECYTGHYSFYGEGDCYLKLRMKTTKGRDRDLTAYIAIGTDSLGLQMALGQFHNRGKTIYSGTLMMLSVQENENPSFFTGEAIKKLPEPVQKYFRDKRQNIMRVPPHIFEFAEFNEWHERKNKKRKNQ